MSDDVKIPKSEYDMLRLAAGQLEIMRSLGFKEVVPPAEKVGMSCDQYKNDLDALTGCQIEKGMIKCSRCSWVSGWSVQKPNESPEACAGYDPWDFGLPPEPKEGEQPKFVQFTKENLPQTCGLMGDDESGCMLSWRPGNNSNRTVSTDATQQNFFEACKLAKKQLQMSPGTSVGSVTTVSKSSL